MTLKKFIGVLIGFASMILYMQLPYWFIDDYGQISGCTSTVETWEVVYPIVPLVVMLGVLIYYAFFYEGKKENNKGSDGKNEN